MNQHCLYCHWTLEPGAELCAHCGRWQPPSRTDSQPTNDPRADAWEDEDPGVNANGGPVQQGPFRRGGPLEPPARKRRPLPQAARLTRAPFRQHRLAITILVIGLTVAVVGLGGGAVTFFLAHGGASSPKGQAAGAAPAGQTATSSPATPTTPATIRAACAATGGPRIAFGAGGPHPIHVFDRFLPRDLPLKPLSVDQEEVGDFVLAQNTMRLEIDIQVPSAFQPIFICKITLRLVAFTPIPDEQANVLNGCDGAYLNPGGDRSRNCDDDGHADGRADLTFSSTQVGASVTASVTNDISEVGLVKPNGVEVMEALIHFAAPGTYTFRVGVWSDASGPQFASQNLIQMVLVGHLGHYWGGKACTTADMQALLPPPTSPPGVFVCPGNPPAQ